jgi:hypothetical protein
VNFNKSPSTRFIKVIFIFIFLRAFSLSDLQVFQFPGFFIKYLSENWQSSRRVQQFGLQGKGALFLGFSPAKQGYLFIYIFKGF